MFFSIECDIKYNENGFSVWIVTSSKISLRHFLRVYTLLPNKRQSGPKHIPCKPIRANRGNIVDIRLGK